MSRPPPSFVVGTAGWVVPRLAAPLVPALGSHLERYAAVFGGVEINSSFYRPHAFATYERWARVTPANFRFAVKMPKTITHELKLTGCGAHLDAFLAESAGLGAKRGPVLVQLPPSLAFDARTVNRFFATLRRRHMGSVVCEPRHATWFSSAAEAALQRYEIARVATDPAVVPAAREPGGWRGLTYFRWHGSPRTYWSRYSAATIGAMAAVVRRSAATDPWCVFDNTAAGAALENAWEFQQALSIPTR